MSDNNLKRKSSEIIEEPETKKMNDDLLKDLTADNFIEKVRHNRKKFFVYICEYYSMNNIIPFPVTRGAKYSC